MIKSVDTIAIIAVLFIVAIIIGFIKKIKTNGIGKTITDVTEDIGLEDYVRGKVSDALIATGIASSYEEFKSNVEMYILEQIRNATDEVGGTIDSIVDSVSDGDVLGMIDDILRVSGSEEYIKSAYDELVSKRIKEIDESEAEEAEKNATLETEDLEKYETEENAEEVEPEVVVEDKEE